MNRRSVIILGPAFCATALQSRPANAEPETPVRRMFLEWKELERREGEMWSDWTENGGVIPAECHKFSKQVRAFEQRLVETPCQNTNDFVLKLIAATSGGYIPTDCTAHPALWAEADTFSG